MASSPPIAVYDACVLYPFQLRNLLVQCAADRLVDARWSNEIHDEWIRSLLAREPKLTRARLEATRDPDGACSPAGAGDGLRTRDSRDHPAGPCRTLTTAMSSPRP